MLEAILDGIAVIFLAITCILVNPKKTQFGSVRLLTKADLYPNHTPYLGPIYNRHDREIL